MIDDKGQQASTRPVRRRRSRSSASPACPRRATPSSRSPTRRRRARSPSTAATKQRESELAKTSKVSLDELYQQIQSGRGEGAEGRPQGRRAGLGRGDQRRAAPARRPTRSSSNVIHGSVGGITESRRAARVGVERRSSSASTSARSRRRPTLAEREGVDIRLYTIIYEALNDVRDALEGLLEPTLREKMLGRAEVRQIVQRPEVGHDRRLLRHRRQDHARRAGAPGARPRRRPRRARSAACGASRTTRARSPRLRVRHRPRELPRRQGRRRRSRPTRSRRWRGGSRRRRGRRRAAAGRPSARPEAARAVRAWWSACCVSSCSCPRTIRSRASAACCARSRRACSNKFNVSIAECDDHDLWQRAVLGVSQVGHRPGARRRVPARGGAVHRRPAARRARRGARRVPALLTAGWRWRSIGRDRVAHLVQAELAELLLREAQRSAPQRGDASPACADARPAARARLLPHARRAEARRARRERGAARARRRFCRRSRARARPARHPGAAFRVRHRRRTRARRVDALLRRARRGDDDGRRGRAT